MSLDDTTANMATEPGSANEGDDKVPVLGRLPATLHRDMKIAMAMADIRTNDQFIVEAVEAKTRAILKKRRSADRGEGRAA